MAAMVLMTQPLYILMANLSYSFIRVRWAATMHVNGLRL
jgi:hypothetical protein